MPEQAIDTPAPPADSADPGATDPASAAEAARLAQVAAFEAAADTYASEVGWKTGTPLGRVVIPSIGVDVVMIEGTGKGDEIFLVLPYGVARYIVSRIVIVYPKDVGSVARAGKEQVSLAACHPIYSAKQRIVVQGDLAGFSLTE